MVPAALAFGAVRPSMVLAMPLTDRVCIRLRQLARGCLPFIADREHLHHLLQTLGLGAGRSVA